MNIENNIFKKYIPDYNKLLEYGFNKNKSKYLYEKIFMNNEFKAIITISDKGNFSGKVYDIENNDEFLPLKVESQQGKFVGTVREEYLKILIDIRDKCFLKTYFLSNQANRIARRIIEKYGDKPEFMWKKFPTYGVFKNHDNNKWYSIIMNINRLKLGENIDAQIEIINVKLDKNKIQEYLEKNGYYPAWHMNKKSWITIVLDETLNDNEILNLIEESYSYTIKTK